MPLEDDLCDILKKARTGQKLSVGDVARVTGLPGADLAALERGDKPRDREEIRAIAKALGLRPAPLEQIAFQEWEPEPVPALGGVETVLGDIGGYQVKGYVVHDAGEALFIDTGYNPDAMTDVLRRRGLRLAAVCLTHGHTDHAGGLDRILTKWKVPVYLGPEDLSLLSWRPPAESLVVPDDGRLIRVGGLTVRCIVTPGHTPGGVCYRVEGAARLLCFVGDTLFAGSIGRSNPSGLYGRHLDSVRLRVLKLPEDAALFPGHGPATTVREELDHNPFAA